MVFPVQDITRENRLRLLMIFAAIHPDKFEGDKGTKLMQVAIFFIYLIFFFVKFLRCRSICYLLSLMLYAYISPSFLLWEL